MPDASLASRPRFRRVARFAVYLCFLGLVLEGAARWAVSSDMVFGRIAGPYDEPSWRLNWLRRHRGGETALRLPFDRHHPVRGWSLAPGQRSAEAFGGKGLTSNSEGLRGSREFAVPKPAGVRRIALFGDSFTFGEDVGDDDTFAAQMARLLPDVEILNFGVHGYGHDQMLLYMREALPRFQPDVVLIGHVTDDALRNLNTFRDFAKPRFRRSGESLQLEGVPVPTPEMVLAARFRESRLLDLFEMARVRIEWRWGDRMAEVDRLMDALLTTMAREARAAGARPAIVLLPAWNELRVPSTAPLSGEEFVTQLARRESVPSLRLRPLFVERARLGAEFQSVGHWGALEHRLAAGGIVDFLRREALVP
jgi:hypothetical protein